jgi:tetratricopeptide (TPR) repeat protein
MRRISNPFVLTGLIILVGAVGASQTKAPAPDVSSIAIHSADLAESGRCAEALPHLKKTVRQIPEKELKRRVGLDGVHCAMTLNQLDDVLDFLQVLNHEFPHDPAVLYVSTHAFSDLSTRASQQLATAAPSSYQAHQLLAESYEMQGKWDEAAKQYRTILKTNPQAPGVHFQLGRLLLSKPDPSPSSVVEAKKEMQQELDLDPSNAGAEYVLGELAHQNQEWEEAVTHFSKAAKLDSGFSDAYLGLGTSLLQLKRFPEAVSALEATVKLEPRNPDAHYSLAMAYSRAGRKQDADREFAIHRRITEGTAGAQGAASGTDSPPSPN